MRTVTYFAKECATCGRTLQIKVEYLGKKVTCPHCHAVAVAHDPYLGEKVPAPEDKLSQRIEQLLNMGDVALAGYRTQDVV